MRRAVRVLLMLVGLVVIATAAGAGKQANQTGEPCYKLGPVWVCP